MTTTTIPAGISQNTTACWVLRYADGHEPDATHLDFDPHYSSEAEALTYASAYLPEDAMPGTPVQLDERCWTAHAVCGMPFDSTGEGHIEHNPNPHDLINSAETGEWTVAGGVLCCDTRNCACRATGAAA
ncbi:hypothetical protein [Catenuloplanes indicus]|uniref:Uncharacterized protein n=1 Tax=Catenuloplanes indicus TaxID=137267 RepID=A0AAE3WAT0_9ACTN|nr:hypothetical protein [Catenuloplanes indicus]MDQ0371560.1 hypothetical protein [Catenuloplanes indicus]